MSEDFARCPAVARAAIGEEDMGLVAASGQSITEADLGLEPALRWYVDRFVRRTGLRVKIFVPKAILRIDLIDTIQGAASDVAGDE